MQTQPPRVGPSASSSRSSSLHDEFNDADDVADDAELVDDAGALEVGLDDSSAAHAGGEGGSVSVAEATRLLGVGRARVYQLLDAGALEAVSEQPLRISIASVERRLQTAAPAGAQLAPLSAWAILALASGDAPFLKHVSGLLSDADRSRARSRLRQHRLLELAPRFRGRAQTRGLSVQLERWLGFWPTRGSCSPAPAPGGCWVGN